MNNKTIPSGAGFLDILVIVFIVLKLIGVINWSWLWVLSPMWIPVCIVVFYILVVWIINSAKKE